ncbi:MAG: DUF6504 family protein [Heliobacteriaceae bacterium]|nr:DUF6504 family protein [Heliobacteriaceae bacterium]MDD4588340.1 DUF6504 family protein [Heliobacteriaceae bacterium]
MSRLINRPVPVIAPVPPPAPPLGFCWRQQWYRTTQLLDHWVDQGRWWTGETEKHFFRLATRPTGIFELCCDPQTQKWLLYKIYD